MRTKDARIAAAATEAFTTGDMTRGKLDTRIAVSQIAITRMAGDAAAHPQA